jgi:hypothetical protein
MAIFDSSDEEEEDKAKEDAKKMKNSPDVKPKAASSVKNTAKVAPISPKKQQPAKKAINPSDFFWLD